MDDLWNWWIDQHVERIQQVTVQNPNAHHPIEDVIAIWEERRQADLTDKQRILHMMTVSTMDVKAEVLDRMMGGEPVDWQSIMDT